MKWTGASERTVKNWLSGISGPSGDHLVGLIRHSDEVLEALLALAGRPSAMATYNLINVRAELTEIAAQIDKVFEESVLKNWDWWKELIGIDDRKRTDNRRNDFC